MVIFDRCVKEA
jgi:adenosine deaminase CECR1